VTVALMMSMILWPDMLEELRELEGCLVDVGVIGRFFVVMMRPTVESHAYMLLFCRSPKEEALICAPFGCLWGFHIGQ
jgi:hypothetical protein